MAEVQLRSVKGTQDVLPHQWGWWRRLYGVARERLEVYNYRELRTPILENTLLFAKGTGETTDIVEKQMYTMDAGDGESIALRPEGTPPAVRAYLEYDLAKDRKFQKFYYIGAMFRRERPQKGRLRQFHQIGIEAIGSPSPLLDAETIIVALDIYRSLGLKQFIVNLNSIGCEACRPAYREKVRSLLEERKNDLCEECRRRMHRNVFRVLDCKVERCKEIAAQMPRTVDHLCDECSRHYGEVKEVLGEEGIAFVENPLLVRGLDYYTKTVYEITHPGLGARDTICGGGRYDGLVELLGGPATPCVGFAMGVEASILAMEAELGAAPDSELTCSVYVVRFDNEGLRSCFELVQRLRGAGIAAEMDFEQRSAKAQMRSAHKLGSPLCFLIGSNELEQQQVLIRDMAGGQQWNVPWEDAAQEVERLLKSPSQPT